ncbi:hypothetical protein [Roseococcus sp. YIM B11640]|uniref:hypothetical protein n=1 Tax=Roseococcus sp. YIM B11640 TaxID=3133973 RepID=UPI003C7C103C
MTRIDLSDWRGIAIGHGMMWLYLSAYASIALWPGVHARDPLFTLGGGGAIAAVILLSDWLKGPIRRWLERNVAPDPARHERLKNAAVAVMCVFSAAVTVLGVFVAIRYGR